MKNKSDIFDYPYPFEKCYKESHYQECAYREVKYINRIFSEYGQREKLVADMVMPPFPKSSRKNDISIRAKQKPMLIPRASANESETLFFEANASACPGSGS
jgi:hypothetical protein